LATLTDARVAVEQVVGQRDAIWRRFSPSARP
jgi:hypothetical protein